jgi:hypothetical protein
MSNVIEGYFGSNKGLRIKGVSYTRDLKTAKNLPYDQKFATLHILCEDAASGEFEVVLIAYPEELVDTYEEMMISLLLLANAKLLALTGTSLGVVTSNRASVAVILQNAHAP